MARYIFFATELPDRGRMRAALSTARRFGQVIRHAAGSMLLEVEPERLQQVSEALPGWQHTAERIGGRIPERSPMFKLRMRSRSTDTKR